MTATIKLALSPSLRSHSGESRLLDFFRDDVLEPPSILCDPLPPPSVDPGTSQHRWVAGEAMSVSPGLQVSAGEELPLLTANFNAEDGSGLLDRWPVALELSECTYVNSDREFQL